MKKLFVFLIFALMIASLSAVSAGENVTDDAVLNQDDDADVIQEDNPGSGEADDDSAKDVEVANSSITARATTGYEKFSTKFTVTLKSNGTPLASRQVSIKINGVTYKKVTNTQGQASVSVKLTKGTYRADYSYGGDNTAGPSSGSAKITIKNPYKTKFKVADANVNYRQGLKSIFQVRLLTTGGSAVKNQDVTIKVKGKTYNVKTNSKGYATVYLGLKKGTHKVLYSFKSSCPYLSSSGSTKVKFKASMGKGHGYWLWSEQMKSVNLKTLKKTGTKHIFLQSYAFSYYGKSAVTSWIAKANKYGIKVHIWMQIFYNNGKWISPVNKDGSIKTALIKQKVGEAKKYAKIKGVAGVHFDYARFNGNAYNYETSTQAISYFIKKACMEVRKAAPNCILSASVMPEPGATDLYYGQNIEYMSKYLDVITPMAHKGNYGKTTDWLTYVTASFKFESNGAQIWTGLQTYKSESNAKKLSASELLKDAKAAMKGGAKGVVLFRIGLTKYLNFNKV